MRIAKYISACGICARRKAELLISERRVEVNEEKISDFGRQVDIENDIVKVDGKVCKLNSRVYYLLNKPLGYTTTLFDVHADHIITDLLPKDTFIWPVGRLDRETSGLIIMTNDGDLTQKLTHPSYLKRKTYEAETDSDLSEEDIEILKNGITLEDGFIKPDELVKVTPKNFIITIHEGKNRIIRRIFKYFGKKVIKLERTTLDGIEKGDLQPGEWRLLNSKEVEGLKNG